MPITLADVHSLLASLQTNGFLDLVSHLSTSATWTVANAAYTGQHELFGTKSKPELIEFMLKRYLPIYDGPAKLEFTSVTVMDDRAVVEVHVNGPLKTGKMFDNRYVWIMEFDENKQIVAVRDYLDTLLAYNSIMENEQLASQ